MRTKGVKPMRIGSGDERFFESRRDLHGAAIRIEKTVPEMAELDRIEAVDLFDQLFSHRSAEQVKRMRRDREKRKAAACAQPGQIVQTTQRLDLTWSDVQQNHIRPLEPDFSRGDQENAHPGRVRENFRAIEDRVVQRDGEDTKAERTSTLEQLVG
jgi:hypothetical protein